jgi:hypothetical protein
MFSASREAAGRADSTSPGAPPLPTFFSTMFGGAVPLTGPGGKVYGYYDHQAAKAGLGITAQFSAIAPLLQPGGWMEAAGAKGATPVTAAIKDGIEEALEGHHALPKFMGGAENQQLVTLRQTLHRDFHGSLRQALKDAGFPNVGGPGGGKVDWLDHFARNPDSYNQAVDILRRISQAFDRAHGTAITQRLNEVLGGARPPSE